MLKLVAEYKSSKEIADESVHQPRTVDRHRANIADKLDLKGSHALLHYALEHKTECSPSEAATGAKSPDESKFRRGFPLPAAR